jgi:ribokinase
VVEANQVWQDKTSTSFHQTPSMDVFNVCHSLVFGTVTYCLFKRSQENIMRESKKTTDVVVVGASNIDLITYCKRCPGPGETIHGDLFEQGFGGKGANQAVMASKLGAKTEIVTCVGNDGFGDETVANFKSKGLGISGVLRAPGNQATGVAPIWVDANGENRILIVNGANDCLLPKDIFGSMKNTVENAKVLICQLEIKAETTLASLNVGRGAGVLTILNPAPAPSQPLSSEYYTDADIVAPNQSEAQILTGYDTTSVVGAKKAAKKIIGFGAGCVVMTMGKDGCLIVLNGEEIVVSAPAIEKSLVKDTSGAGDCFLGAFSYHLTRDNNGQRKDLLQMKRLIAAAKYACAAATLSVQKNGTQSSYPDRESVDNFLKQ